jgi:hypothetical protein
MLARRVARAMHHHSVGGDGCRLMEKDKRPSKGSALTNVCSDKREGLVHDAREVREALDVYREF